MRTWFVLYSESERIKLRIVFNEFDSLSVPFYLWMYNAAYHARWDEIQQLDAV